ncbi:hypothetical protein M2451_004141 [Dysgonomonas sp. PFB1-18]|uniref:hypothetical protein n=1 Tax=unclassified Dysgonomonas TaxID=2630389 RepID=UPI00247366CC|nr:MULTISPECIES: hypothetical protein [unclassified Dysgonomonas]MDH6310672.1 hypothetical protein [Dysgonomonas sp. PF1-14]MDH6340523.1 hypothetical protein [Dysgonomonas sp. PF1-16]MDH6382790.1 hypothetical protein [Dysgonomonas sp. PFB1-18]MDH6399564.1 hypothetical protein [Dysgonomonas sp. PF1-23]
MKKAALFLAILFVTCLVTQAQEDIFKKHGVTKEPLTLSKGKYKETFYNEEIMQVGTVLINTLTNKVVKFLEEDTTKFAYKAETTSRFLTVDPLAEEHYSWSPYAYVLNNPMRYIDPDGRLERDPNGNIKFYASGESVSRETVKHNGFSLTPNYSTGYVVTDKGNKVSAEQLTSVTVVSADGKRSTTFSATELSKVGDFDFTSNCHGLAMADGQFFINDPGTILADEFTKVGEGMGPDAKAGANHNVVSVGLPGFESEPYHTAGTQNNGNTYTQKDNNGPVKTNQPLKSVVDYKGTGTVSGLPVKELQVVFYEKKNNN